MNPIVAWVIALSAVLILSASWLVFTPVLANYFGIMIDDFGVEGPTTFINTGLVIWNLAIAFGILGFILWAILSTHETEYESKFR